MEENLEMNRNLQLHWVLSIQPVSVYDVNIWLILSSKYTGALKSWKYVDLLEQPISNYGIHSFFEYE